MMNQQPDKFFRDKLENASKTVSSSAWSRIDNNLSKKNNTAIWLRVAAALLLLAVATILLWPRNQATQIAEEKKIIPSQENSATEKTIKPQQETKPNNHEKWISKRTPEKHAQKKAASVAEAKQVKPQSEIVSNGIKEVAHEAVEDFSIAENDVEMLTMPQAEIPLEEKSIVESVSKTSSSDEGVTLIYSAEEVNEKYLDKKALADATSEEKKSSTLRKLLDKAYDLKNNQDPFGDLRQKKNEILALNFKSEKQRSQNK